MTADCIHLDVFNRPQSARAVDWIDFLLYIVPTLVYEQLESANCLDVAHLMNLFIGCGIALSWDIDDDDIAEMERYGSNDLYLRLHLPNLRRCLED